MMDVMSSFVRRTSAAALAFGVVTGSFALGASAFADEASETPAATATPTDSAAPGDAAPADDQQQPSASSDKPSYTANERIQFTLAGFAPETPFTISVTSEGGTQTVVVPVDNEAVTDAQGGYQGEIEGQEGGLPAGRHTFTFTQEGGASASFEITVVSEGPQAPLEPSASAVKPSFLPNENVEFLATGFTAGATVHAEVTFPDGEVVPVEGEAWTVDDTGAFAGALEYSDLLPVGSYTVRLFQEDGVQATFTFDVVAEDGQQAPAPAPSEGSGVGSTTGPRQDTGNQLATTGPADAFGPAGLGLLLAASGAAALTARRLGARRG